MPPKSGSAILEAVHETARDLYAAGLISQITLREYDHLCAQPIEPLQPAEIRLIRESQNVSQAVFALVLNTSLSTVQKWEVGQKKPTGTALKLLNLVQRRGMEAIS